MILDIITSLIIGGHFKHVWHMICTVGPCGLGEVKQFQIHLTDDYQINIVSKGYQNSILYSGPEKEKEIYLFLNDNNDVITSVPAFFARK